MVATIRIMRVSGSINGGVYDYSIINSASARASTSDSASPGTSNPVPIPSSGCNHTYWVSAQLYSACAPDNSITNIKWYTDGTNTFGTGTECMVAAASSYVQATGAAGSSGSILSVANHAGLTNAPSNAFQYTSAAASQLSVTGSIAAATGSFGYYVVYQVSVASTASAGNSGEETFTFAYDEA